MSNFVHLHTHSHYSLLSALPKIPDLIKVASDYDMDSLALTDSGNLYGAIEFYKKCESKEIKPIIGIDAYVAARTRHDKQAGVDNRRTRLVLLAQNLNGYKNLIKIVTKSNLEGFYYKPRVDYELLEKYSDGLISIIPFWNSELGNALQSKNTDRAKELALWYKTVFGKNTFLEITRHASKNRASSEEKILREFAESEKIKLVAGQEVFYLKPDDKRARDTLLSVQNNQDFSEIGSSEEEIDLSFLSEAEMKKKFKGDEELVERTAEIASSTDLKLDLGKWVFPDYKTEGGMSHDDELKKKAFEGLKYRKIEKTKEIEERINYELNIIKKKGYSPYFLVVSDLLNYAHDNHILTTTRGSAAGSLVSFLTGITNVNPMIYKLPFERFLNPERPSAPDIDMDIADNCRDKMIEYAKKKYGSDKVAQIGTFGTMMARGSVRDVARALGFEYSSGDKIAKLIPFGSQGFPMTIDTALEMVPDLKKLYKQDRTTREIIDMAKKIEGCARHISVHAAGVVISPSELTDYVPLQYDTKGENKIITQYDMHGVEDAGLLKFDFLGIKNLAILSNAVSLVKKLENKKIDIENVPLDDKKTFEMLALGETSGLFQLNGSGMTRYLKDLKPSTINDVNAMVALYRPGPMESIPEYIERKHNPKLVKYLDPRLKDILSTSYGIITYQDDVMLIAIKLAGYSWLEADKLRKAMGKKIPKEMEAQKEKLLTGFVENGLTKEKAEELWKLIEPFAAYGFNKAHAASYGKVAYQTAYMKANFPAIYMSAVLTADSGDVEKIGEIINECKRLGIPVLPPDINESFEDFTVVKGDQDKIRFGLTTIKNFGEGIAGAIIKERKERGKFKTLGDFLERVRDKNLNKKSLEALIKSGSMDKFGERGSMLENLEGLLEYNRDRAKEPENQSSLFGQSVSSAHSLHLKEASPATSEQKLMWEKELLGLYISGHPLDKFKDKFEKREVDIKKVKEKYREGMEVVLGGIIEEVKTIITKKNAMMAFAKLADFSGSIEMVIFPKTYEEMKDKIVADSCVAVKARVSNRNGETSIIVEKVKVL